MSSEGQFIKGNYLNLNNIMKFTIVFLSYTDKLANVWGNCYSKQICEYFAKQTFKCIKILRLLCDIYKHSLELLLSFK